MFDTLKYDLKRYFSSETPVLRIIEGVCFTPGIWAILIYRAGNRIVKIRNDFFREPLILALQILKLFICMPAGIDISFDTRIGKGLYIGHYGGIVVNDNVEMGEYCNISHGVTIGIGGRNTSRGCPKLGNRVYIAPGAKIFGKITIGDDVAIGANAVVLDDVPNRAVVGGVPAKILNYNSSSDFIHYIES